MKPARHFLSLLDLSADELDGILRRAAELKQLQRHRQPHATLNNVMLAMLFEKASTRTRVSFATAIKQLGGDSLFLSPQDTHVGRGEPIADTARVLSSMVDVIMLRTFGHERLTAFADHSTAPVINGLTDLEHPCQLLADLQTWYEHRGSIKHATVAWLGDGNNTCHSWIHAAQLLGFKLRIACPAGYEPDADILSAADNAVLVNEPALACADADLLVTDVWASMGQEQEQQQRADIFRPYQVNQQLLNAADRDALFMHCLPAHRGEEVTAEVIDGPQSVVWDEAENRLHAQKALLEFLLRA